jgi:hypothetical protein
VLTSDVNWAAPTAIINGPILTFTSNSSFYLAGLDGSLLSCEIDGTSITVSGSKQFLISRTQVVVEGEHVWNSI